MDIRSIIDSEDTPSARKPSVPATVKQEYRPNPAGYPSPQAPAYDNRREVRPPQPSPLQTPAQNDSHYPTAPPHDNLRSPYKRTPSFGFNNGHYPPAQAPSQSPIYGHQALHYPQREGNSVSGAPSSRPFGHSTPHARLLLQVLRAVPALIPHFRARPHHILYRHPTLLIILQASCGNLRNHLNIHLATCLNPKALSSMQASQAHL